jgi:hypothetical protein
MAAYSFADVSAVINGPGGNFALNGGAADEGISIEYTDAKNTMTPGADGSIMHSLHASKSGKVTVRLLKTSPVNALLTTMYNFQTTSAANHGQNTIVVRDPVRGDIVTCRECAFSKHTNVTWAKDGGMNEWTWDAGFVDPILGTGQPVAAF